VSAFSRATAFALIISVASGCSSVTGVPDFDTLGVGQSAHRDAKGDAAIHPSDIVLSIKCELWRGVSEYKPIGNEPSMKDMLKDYVVGISLNLRVDDNGGASPSVSFINPYPNMQSLNFGFGAQLNETRQRTYSEDFLIFTNELDGSGCGALRQPAASINGISLLGNLGLIEVAKLGLNSVPPTDTAIYPGVLAGGTGSYTVPNKAEAARGSRASFGSTIQFTITRSIGAGPTWTYSNFKGPSGTAASGAGGAAGSSSLPGGTSLLNFGRTDTHSLLVAFAYVPPDGNTLEAKASRAHNQMVHDQQAAATISDGLADLKRQQTVALNDSKHAHFAGSRRTAKTRYGALTKQIQSQTSSLRAAEDTAKKSEGAWEALDAESKAAPTQTAPSQKAINNASAIINSMRLQDLNTAIGNTP
jgi:hypothetical protein